MKLRHLFTVISILILMAGCQSLPGDGPTVGEAADILDEDVQPQPFEPREAVIMVEQAPVDLWGRIRGQLSWQDLDHASVEKARSQFLAQANYLPVVANRANYYLYYIVERVEARGFPMEIALLPLVESTLNPFASSPSRAAGLWQIMPATGRHLGLQQDWWYDGRRDLRDSTRAALDYLEELHEQFDGDWLLALAAYNSGKSRVARARRDNEKKGLGTDFWSLKLPRETRNYVPRLIALAQIVADPQRFDVAIPTVPNEPSFELAATGGQLEIVRAAELAGVKIGTLRAFNPGQLRWATSPNKAPEILLPLGKSAQFARGLAALTEADRVQWQHYRIARGDTLSEIASQFGTQVSLLREVNGVRGSRIRAGDTLLIPQGNGWASSLALAGGENTTARGYRVRRGDSLYRIAGKFNISIADIIAWNSLDPSKFLQPGQKLTLYVSGS